jgi:hypothetical protein
MEVAPFTWGGKVDDNVAVLASTRTPVVIVCPVDVIFALPVISPKPPEIVKVEIVDESPADAKVTGVALTGLAASAGSRLG